MVRPPGLSRREALLAGLGAASLRAGAQVTAAPDPTPWAVRAVTAGEPMRQLHAGGPSGLLGTGAGGTLWALSLTGEAPRRIADGIADGIDAATPIATGHGRIAARMADGGLWVWEDASGGGRARASPAASLSVHAGLLILPLAVLAVVNIGAQQADPSGHRLARFEPDQAGRWREVARSKDAVLPDARPLQVDLDGRRDGRGDGGHIAVLAGPDGARYDHGVLGDAIEATRVLWLERHGLEVLRELSLPAPHVFEDIAPRPVMLPGTPAGLGLLTVRSGPDGGQLALVRADLARPGGLRMAALGDTVGGFHRWLAPTTDGRHLAAVHTPHIGGVLHVYRQEGETLARRRVVSDVSTHRIGTRETDLAAWLQGLLVLPSQDGRRLRLLNPAADWTELKAVALPGRAILTTAVPDAAALAVLLDDGQVVLVGPTARKPSRG